MRYWARRSSDTEDEKRERTEAAIRDVRQEDAVLGARSLNVFAKGSYKNNTNVRQDSDVDIAIEATEYFRYELGGDFKSSSGSDVGISPYPGTYSVEQLKDEAEAAMVRRFGRSAVRRGNKAIEVHASSYWLQADVVPCVTYHYYYARDSYGRLSYHEGILIHADSGEEIVNYPRQTHDQGNAKNIVTGRRYKRVVRILKRLENKMVEEGIIEEVPSFLIESLVFNVTDYTFQHANYYDDVREVLAYLYKALLENEESALWTEVNGIKYLFHPSQKWTRGQAFSFVDHAWDYIAFN
jgi:hypothetical protein